MSRPILGQFLCDLGAEKPREAHASVVFTILEALYAYVHTLRSFNGELESDLLEAAARMFHVGRSIWVP